MLLPLVLAIAFNPYGVLLRQPAIRTLFECRCALKTLVGDPTREWRNARIDSQQPVARAKIPHKTWRWELLRPVCPMKGASGPELSFCVCGRDETFS